MSVNGVPVAPHGLILGAQSTEWRLAKMQHYHTNCLCKDTLKKRMTNHCVLFVGRLRLRGVAKHTKIVSLFTVCYYMILGT